MKTKILTTILLIAFLGAFTTAEAQTRNERKLKREMAKLEKQMKKVRELQGEFNWVPYQKLERINEYELKKAREIQKHALEQALRQREHGLQQAQRAKDYYKQYQEKAIQDGLRSRAWAENFREGRHVIVMKNDEMIQQLKQELEKAKQELKEEIAKKEAVEK